VPDLLQPWEYPVSVERAGWTSRVCSRLLPMPPGLSLSGHHCETPGVAPASPPGVFVARWTRLRLKPPRRERNDVAPHGIDADGAGDLIETVRYGHLRVLHFGIGEPTCLCTEIALSILRHGLGGGKNCRSGTHRLPRAKGEPAGCDRSRQGIAGEQYTGRAATPQSPVPRPPRFGAAAQGARAPAGLPAAGHDGLVPSVVECRFRYASLLERVIYFNTLNDSTERLLGGVRRGNDTHHGHNR